MPDQRIPAATDRHAGEDDDIVQAAVMTQILVLHPAQLTLEELMRQMGADAQDFRACDELRCAVRDLTRSGLLHRHGAFVLPTRAALRFNELPEAGT